MSITDLAGDLETLRDAPSVSSVVSFDTRARRACYEDKIAGGITELSPSGLDLCVLACHYDGRIRQRAVRRLAVLDDEMRVPILLLRLNDWVPQVRTEARRTLEPLLVEQHRATLIRHADLVLHLETCGRDEHAWVIDRVRDLVRSASTDPGMPMRVAQLGRRQRRVLLDWLTETGDRDWLRLGLRDPDTVIRLRTARRVSEATGPGDLDDELALMEADPMPAIRRQALYLRLDRRPDTVEPALRRALLDASSAVRGTAQFFAERGGIDRGDFYRVALRDADDRTLAAAVAGLGRFAAPGDVDAIAALADHRRVAVRAEVATALHAIAGPTTTVRFVGDTSPRIRRLVTDLLSTDMPTEVHDRIVTIASTHERAEVRAHAVTLLPARGFWAGLAALMEATSDTSESVRETAVKALMLLTSRLNRIYTKPTRDQLESIASARHRAVLPAEVASAIDGRV